MSEPKDVVKFCLKVMIHKERNKVLFAEADGSFADVLISFLTMPLGRALRILKNHYGDETPAIGSLTSLYHGFANPEVANFWTEGCKEALLNPTSPFQAECRRLKLDVSDTQPAEYFTCANRSCAQFGVKFACRSAYYDTAKCWCRKLMTREVVQEESRAVAVFTKYTSFVISDDLQIFPNISGLVQTLTNLGITDTKGAELYNVTFGFNEVSHCPDSVFTFQGILVNLLML